MCVERTTLLIPISMCYYLKLRNTKLRNDDKISKLQKTDIPNSVSDF